MSNSDEQLSTPLDAVTVDRRNFLRRAGLTAAAAAIVPAVAASLVAPAVSHAASAAANAAAAAAAALATDIAVLNFALNLEYLEAEFYTYAVIGQGIEAFGIPVIPKSSSGATLGTAGTTTIKANPKVSFADPLFYQYAAEVSADERSHVLYLQQVITALGGTPVSRPALDLVNSFNTLASAAGIASTFDPFADQTSFFLGSFIFEDVGVTAYHGAAGLITNKSVLFGAAGVLAVEAYHSGEVRTVLARMNATNSSVGATVAKISALRATLAGASDDQGLTDSSGLLNIVPTDNSGIAFGRTTRQVENIVYGAPNATKGLFYPNGLNGAIVST